MFRVLSFLSTALPLLALLLWSVGVNGYYTVPYALAGGIIFFDLLLMIVAKMKFQNYRLSAALVGVVLPVAVYAIFVLLRAFWANF